MKAGLLKFRPMLCFQAHDEQVIELYKENSELVRGIVADAIGDVNKAMKLSVELGCDIQFGNCYSDIH